MKGDIVIKQLNLSYNITAEELYDAKDAVNFFKKFKKALAYNRYLFALDLAGITWCIY